MKKPIEKGLNLRQQNQILSQKKLQLLLPSSKQLLLVNSSIKYNCPSDLNQHDTTLTPRGRRNSREKMSGNDKENTPYQTRTSILRIEEHPEDRESQQDERGQTAAQLKEKSLNILANTYKKLAVQSVGNNNKPFSSLQFPHYKTQNNQLTSITNIIQQPCLQSQSDSKKELLDRIAKLQNLVFDIITGKVPIPRSQSQKKIKQSPSKRETFREIGDKVMRKEQRSITEWKQSQVNKSMVKSNKRVRIENPIVQKRDELELRPLRGFMIKKKNQLKLDNYKPLRDMGIEQRSILRKASMGQQTERPKLKLRVNFIPNIINL